MTAPAPAPASRQQAGPYLCHALAPAGWLPPVEVPLAGDAWMWLVSPLRAIFDELRVTDATGDECLIHVVGDDLKFPTHVECGMTEGEWREFWRRLAEERREARGRLNR
jgi:hypothetical protein